MDEASAAVTIRRHWGAFRTPWVVRKLRKSPATRAQLPDAYAYTGSSAEAGSWVAALVAATGSFSHPPTGMEWTAQAPRRPRWRRPDAGDVMEMAVDFGSGNGGGGSTGGGGGVDIGALFDADGFAVAILVIIGVVILAAIAVPLGLLAIELVLAFGLVAAGAVLRLARLKPWTVLVLRHGIVVAAVAVKGWRKSGAVIAALRQHTT
jgi:hypothetical protein